MNKYDKEVLNSMSVDEILRIAESIGLTPVYAYGELMLE